MTRNELYNKITPCGKLNYLDMVYLIQNVVYNDPSLMMVFLQRIQQGGQFSRDDWEFFAKSIVFVSGSPINSTTVVSWLENKCSFSKTELENLLEYVQFTDGSQPTYVLVSEPGEFIIPE